jgi:hypothetical protein
MAYFPKISSFWRAENLEIECIPSGTLEPLELWNNITIKQWRISLKNRKLRLLLLPIAIPIFLVGWLLYYFGRMPKPQSNAKKGKACPLKTS